MQFLEKVFTREHSVFYFSSWAHAEAVLLKTQLEQSKLDNMLVVNEPGTHKSSVYYSSNELKPLLHIIREHVTQDPTYYDTISTQHEKLFHELLPYFTGEKKIQNVEELKTYYETYTNWWVPMAIIFNVPELEHVSDVIKARALRTRTETERYSDVDLGPEFVLRVFPTYTKYAYDLTPAEVFRLPQGLTQEGISSIQSRQKDGYIIHNATLYPLNELAQILSRNKLQFEELQTQDVTTIKGNVACQGQATGRVHLIRSNDELDNVVDGEILVTEMTNPKYMMAMKKAAAIITDEGGITCHAAIVSRELNKPCIIGTKVATTILRDGDTVEVNATTGVVTILKRG